MSLSLSNLKIRDQIFVVSLPPLLALLVVLILLFYGYWMAGRTAHFLQKSQARVAQTEAAWGRVVQMRSDARDYALTGQGSSLGDYHVSAKALEGNLNRLRELESGEAADLAALENLNREIDNWQRTAMVPLLGAAQADRLHRLSAGKKEEEQQFMKIRAALSQLMLRHERAREDEIARTGRGMRRLFGAGFVVLMVFGGLLLFFERRVSRSISRPVHQLIEASERVGHGNFRLSLPLGMQNEFGALAGSFLRMTEALRQQQEELSALKRFSESVNQCTSESEVYDHILHALQERFRPSQVIILKLRPEEDLLEAVATLVPLPKELQDWPVMEGKHSCKAVRMGRAFHVNDAAEEPLCPGKFALPEKGSYYCAPLIAGGIIIGAVRLEGERGFWTPERASLLESHLSVAASVLSNLHLLQTMREQANVDSLTGLHNRRFCEDYAHKLMAMARRKDTPLGFIMMDLDHFKSFNDIYGHEVGDRILRQFAKTVTQTMRETNLTARMGGEEFVVLLPDTGPKACEMVAERIRKAVQRMTVASGTDKPLPQITLSLGVAIYPDHGSSLEDVLQAADRALYDSKRGGRNRTTVYAEETETAG